MDLVLLLQLLAVAILLLTLGTLDAERVRVRR